MVGTMVGKYQLLGVVGRGGMGCVYEALNTSINKRVAMKCIDAQLARNDEANARFQREALAASAIESPHIVQIFDAGETDEGMPFIVMELLRGRDLGRHLAKHGPLELDEALILVAQVLKGLHHAHEAGIVHRDLKPDNIFMVSREDEPVLVKLLDFGVSKIARPGEDVPLETLTRPGTVVGTPYYMSPEQAQAFPNVDGRTDIYSVGAILYECLAGRPPHLGNAYEQVIVNICMNDPVDIRDHNPDVPAAIAAVVAKSLARERDDRFGSARAMLAALQEQVTESLGLASSASQLARISARSAPQHTPRMVTPHVITPSSQPANELADTLQIADGPLLAESGISQRDTIRRETSQRQSSERDTVDRDTLPIRPASPSPPRRQLVLLLGAALLVMTALWLRYGQPDASQPATTTAVPATAATMTAATMTAAPKTAVTPVAADTPTVETQTAAAASQTRPTPAATTDHKPTVATRNELVRPHPTNPSTAPAVPSKPPTAIPEPKPNSTLTLQEE